VFAVESGSTAATTVALEFGAIQKRDLSLKQPLDINKGFTESRTTMIIKKGESHFIEDITSTET
jgi:hypothetical protein